MYFVYIIQSEVDESYYIGSSENVKSRIWEHNFGRTGYTKNKRPWVLKYERSFVTKTEALVEEKRLKRCKSRDYLKKIIMGR